MATSYELMDLDSGNLVGSYRTMEEAFVIVRNAYADHGKSGVADLGLVRIGDDGSQVEIAAGSELAYRATGNTIEPQRSERTA